MDVTANKAAIDGGTAFASWKPLLSFSFKPGRLDLEVSPRFRSREVWLRVGMTTGFEGVAGGAVRRLMGFAWRVLGYVFAASSLGRIISGSFSWFLSLESLRGVA